MQIEILNRHIFPQTNAIAITGVVLTWLGIALALWARWHLGQYWSARVTLKEDHQLIRTGPYKYFRNPIYSGLILASIGGALAIDRWRCVVGVALITLGYWIKARKRRSDAVRSIRRELSRSTAAAPVSCFQSFSTSGAGAHAREQVGMMFPAFDSCQGMPSGIPQFLQYFQSKEAVRSSLLAQQAGDCRFNHRSPSAAQSNPFRSICQIARASG